MKVLRKEIVRAGKYQMGDGTPFLVTPERIRHWAETFQEMNAMKINVPTCKDHLCDAANTVGCVSKMEAEGDSLYAVLEFPREQEAELAKTNDVSIATRDCLITGVKNFYDAIEHVALTPRPAVPGLNGYSLICSLGDIQQPAQPDTSKPSDGGNKSQSQNAGGGVTSSYALQKAMEIVSSIFGIAIPPEATRSEEAAIAYLSTVAACKQAGMVQEMKPAPPAAPPAPAEPAEPSEPDDQSKPVPPADQDQQTPPQDGEGKPTDEPGENPPDDQTQNPPDQKPDQDADQDGVNDNTNTPDPNEDDENQKKKKTPGEDGIIASLNDYRRMKIESLISRGGIPAAQVQGQLKKFCSCRDQSEYFSSMKEFESFQSGLELSLSGHGSGNILTSTLTGPQITDPDGGDNKNKRVPAFVQMARSASRSK